MLIRGEAGSGKSTLALALIEAAGRQGRLGLLVADDRTRVTVASHRLVARPHPAVAGLIEQRGRGLVRMPFAPAAVVRLVVDLAAAPPRMPEADAVTLAGIRLPALALPSRAASAETVLRRLTGLQAGDTL